MSRRPRFKNGQFRRDMVASHLGLLIFLATLLAGLFFQSLRPSNDDLISPIPRAMNIQVQAREEISLGEEQTVIEKPEDWDHCKTQKCEIMKEIVNVFGDDAPRAIAVAKAESGLNPNRENKGKAGSLPKIPNYKGECSIGLFQINLASDGCSGHKVHWNKVPGNNLEEKIAWLKVPENNIKFAYEELYLPQGKKFGAWSAFTNGSYRSL